MMNYLLRESVRESLEKFFASVSKDFEEIRTLGLTNEGDPLFEVGSNLYLCIYNSDTSELTARLLATDFGELDIKYIEELIFDFNEKDKTLTLKRFFVNLPPESQNIYFTDVPEKGISSGTIIYHRLCPKGGCTFKLSIMDLKSKVPEVQVWIEDQLETLA